MIVLQIFFFLGRMQIMKKSANFFNFPNKNLHILFVVTFVGTGVPPKTDSNRIRRMVGGIGRSRPRTMQAGTRGVSVQGTEFCSRRLHQLDKRCSEWQNVDDLGHDVYQLFFFVVLGCV